MKDYLPFNDIRTKINLYFRERKFAKVTYLCNSFTSHGSDKGCAHNYSTFYDFIFSDIKGQNLNVFELGLGTNNLDIPSNMGESVTPGASLRAWRDYFENSMIYGADIDKDILFEEERIKTFYIDQTSKQVIDDSWDNPELKNVEFDIIIDDALHEYDANTNFFECSIQKLKSGGIYIIEDIMDDFVDEYEKWLRELIDLGKYHYVEMISIPSYYTLMNMQEDNRLAIIVK